MATKPSEVTTIKFMTAKDIKLACGIGIHQAQELVRKLSEELTAMGYIVFPGKIPEAYVIERIVYQKKKEAKH